jgi:hypothetical protein
MPADPSQFRIQRIAQGESAAAWVGALATFDPKTARVLKQEGTSAVYQTQLLGRDVVVKNRELRGLKERVKLWRELTRGFRHWNGANWLIDNGVATAKPWVLATQRGPRTLREWLVLELLPGKTLIQHIADRDLSVRQEHAVARQLARPMPADATGITSHPTSS